MKKTRPFLKWAGSKYNCIETILSALPTANRLIEPFTGSGAIFINSTYNAYLLAEQNMDLILLYQCLQREGLSFIDYCKTLFSEETNNRETYYRFRAEFNACADTRRRAALFLYLNRHGYNGLCRYNSQGIFNVPFGSYTKPYFPDHAMLHFYEKSRNVLFVHNDFRKTFLLAKPGDLIYCDPPYVPLSKSANFSAYTNKGFNENDQIELANLARAYASQGITVVISNHDTDFTRLHYKGSKIISFPVMRVISCNSMNRVPVQELVAIFSK
jgi:DNA adenine methylase